MGKTEIFLLDLLIEGLMIVKVQLKIDELDRAQDTLDDICEKYINQINFFPIRFDPKAYKIETTARMISNEINYKQAKWGILNNEDWVNFQNIEKSGAREKFIYEKIGPPISESFTQPKKDYIKLLIKTKAGIQTLIGNLYDMMEVFNKAEKYFHLYVKLIENNYGKTTSFASNAYFILGSAYHRRFKFRKSILCYETCLKIRESLNLENANPLADCYINLGLVLLDVKDFDESQEVLQEGEATIIKHLGRNHTKLAKIYDV